MSPRRNPTATAWARLRACSLAEKMPDMALDCLLGEEEADTDLAVHEAIRDQLEHLDLARCRVLAGALRRRLERDDLRHRGVAASRDRLEAGSVLPIPVQNLIALCSVHGRAIGRSRPRLYPRTTQKSEFGSAARRRFEQLPAQRRRNPHRRAPSASGSGSSTTHSTPCRPVA